jgi:adsorption protein B
MLLYEEEHGDHFDVVVTHDAEDLIHPDSLRWMNFYAGDYGFVQIPVLALHTPAANLTHGVYCDEFAEFQTRDLPARNFSGGFVPSAGVGTAYSRQALEALANSAANRIFEPECLTEDYENGFRLHALGFRQIFVPITKRDTFVATREYFPRRMSAAIGQRTRWTTGIALQTWQRHGWSGGWRQVYWFWRDRKGLIGNPVSLFTNAMCAYALATQFWQRWSPPRYLAAILGATMFLQVVRTAVRIGCTARVYGARFSLLVPVRMVVANIINAAAVARAIRRYAMARWNNEPLRWIKTEHAYPSRAALLERRRRIGEILVGSGYLEAEDLDGALATKPETVRLGEHLVALGKLSEEDLYEALSLQQQLPLVTTPPVDVPRRVARALPAHVATRWNVLPFRVHAGCLDVAGTDIPDKTLESELRGHTALEVRFHLMTPEAFRTLQERLK